MTEHRNVLGEKLETCSIRPMIGFYRTGCCETGEEDTRAHVVCGEVTEEFLAFSKGRENDFSTPVPERAFPGLKPGDRWCLCATRWQEALDAGMAPRVVLRATHEEGSSTCRSRISRSTRSISPDRPRNGPHRSPAGSSAPRDGKA